MEEYRKTAELIRNEQLLLLAETGRFNRFHKTKIESNLLAVSQECSSCHYVDKKNRKSQAKFLCLHCGCKKHADANASRNLVWRRSLNGLSSVYVSKGAILDRLVKRFIGGQKYGCKATAPDYIKKNPYFKGHL